jgi:hypothetical protein
MLALTPHARARGLRSCMHGYVIITNEKNAKYYY